jgi:hypothetical protein
MAYTYVDGDGLTVLDKTTPVGATEPVSNLDDAIRQIKAYLKDAVGGAAKLTADLATLQTSVSTLALNYYFAAYRTTAQTFAAGAGYAILLANQADVNPQTGFNTTTGRFTVPKAGWWNISCFISLVTSASSTPTDIKHNLDLFINGTSAATKAVRMGTSEEDVDIRYETQHYLQLNDVIDLRYSLTVASGTMSVESSIDLRNQGIRGVRVAS